ncbi:uncharacterized protein LOC143818514 [Ranitomeya variabilis]|uniref:uncharacterized protein LOC143818514 n=1 Tax=Ranitomeya variabilis TaxID=490064 RepID=UPI0040577C8A
MVAQKGAESQKGAVTRTGVMAQKGVESRRGAESRTGVVSKSRALVRKGGGAKKGAAISEESRLCSFWLDGECVRALIDPGREASLLRALPGNSVSPGDTKCFQVATIYIVAAEVSTYHEVAVVPILPYPMVIGQDLEALWEKAEVFVDIMWMSVSNVEKAPPRVDSPKVGLTKGKGATTQLTDLTSPEVCHNTTGSGLVDKTSGADTQTESDLRGHHTVGCDTDSGGDCDKSWPVTSACAMVTGGGWGPGPVLTGGGRGPGPVVTDGGRGPGPVVTGGGRGPGPVVTIGGDSHSDGDASGKECNKVDSGNSSSRRRRRKRAKGAEPVVPCEELTEDAEDLGCMKYSEVPGKRDEPNDVTAETQERADPDSAESEGAEVEEATKEAVSEVNTSSSNGCPTNPEDGRSEIELVIETVNDHVERERVLRQAAERRVDELEREVSELRGHLFRWQSVYQTLKEDIVVLREALKGPLQGKEVVVADFSCQYQSGNEGKAEEELALKAEQDGHPVVTGVLMERSMARQEPSVLEESETPLFKCVIDVPVEAQDACTREGVHEAFKKAVEACRVHWALETKQLVILSTKEVTVKRVAVLRDMHLQCLCTKQMVLLGNSEATRCLEQARKAQSRLGLVEDTVQVPRALVAKLIGRFGKVMQEMVDVSVVKRLRIPAEDEAQVGEDGMVSFLVVGSKESLANIRMLLRYRVAYLREIEQLRLYRRQVNKQLQNIRWRPPSSQGKGNKRDMYSSRCSDGGSDSDQLLVSTVCGTNDRTNRGWRPWREGSSKETNLTKGLVTQTDCDLRAKAQGLHVDRWGRGKLNNWMVVCDAQNRLRRFSRQVGQGNVRDITRDPTCMTGVQPHKQRGGICDIVTPVTGRGRCMVSPVCARSRIEPVRIDLQ